MKLNIYFWRNFIVTIVSIFFYAVGLHDDRHFRFPITDNIRTFSQLPETDTLQVLFSFSGCFGGDAYQLAFQRRSIPTVTRSLDWHKLSDEQKIFSYKQGEKLTQVMLTNFDLIGLDNLLHFYRHNHKTGCTTTENIVISQIHDGKIISRENFINESCTSPNNVTTFRDIARRLEHKK
jgi:hypothetical protein